MARTAEPDTVAVIQAMHEKLSYRAIAHELGLDHRTWPPTLRRIARGETVSVYKENYVRRALGMEPVTLMVETPACPDCGSVHSAGRCNGKPVTVRLVRPDGTSKRKRYWRPCLPHDMTADQKRRIMEIAEE